MKVLKRKQLQQLRSSGGALVSQITNLNQVKLKTFFFLFKVVHKGIQAANVLEASPAILIDPNTGRHGFKNGKYASCCWMFPLGRVKVVVSTTETKATQGEFFVSNFKLRPHRYLFPCIIARKIECCCLKLEPCCCYSPFIATKTLHQW